MSWTDADVAKPEEAWSDADIAPPKKPTPMLQRALHGVMDPVIGAAQIADKAINPLRQMISPGASSMADVTRQRDAEYVAPEGVDWARMGGNVANPLNWAGGPASLPRMATIGAAQGVLNPASADDYEDNFLSIKAKDAALGGTLGVGAKVLTKAVGGLVTPTKEAQVLLDKGVGLTPGQAAGAGSKMGRFEEWMSSGLGGVAINPARKRAIEDANIAAAKAVSDLVDKNVKLGRPPTEAVATARDTISKTYDAALEGIKVPAADTRAGISQFVSKVSQENPMMEPKELKTMSRFLDTRLLELQRRGITEIDGKMAKQLDSEIGQHIRDLGSSTDMAAKTAIGGWRDLQQQFRDTMAHYQPDPDKTVALSSANAAYRQLLAIEKARPKGSETFTPRQLRATLERMGIKGTELNRVSEAMEKTLPNTVPNSGTAERLIMNALPAVLMGGGAGASNMGYDTVGAGLMAAGALGSRAGSRAVMGATAPQQFAKKLMTPRESQIAAMMAAAMRGDAKKE